MELSIRGIVEQPSKYLRVAETACYEFQSDIRKLGVQSFNVWKYFEEEFKKKCIIENRKPPAAAKIFQWFNPDPFTGSKMGTEDLKFICYLINNPAPLEAYYEEAIKPFLESQRKAV
jgi:hypothetical protein